jgi:hypothetical protein
MGNKIAKKACANGNGAYHHPLQLSRRASRVTENPTARIKETEMLFKLALFLMKILEALHETTFLCE